MIPPVPNSLKVSRAVALFCAFFYSLIVSLLIAVFTNSWEWIFTLVGMCWPTYFLFRAGVIRKKRSAQIMSLLGLGLLAFVVGSMALRIEILNAQAGSPLPRDVESIRAAGGNPKWRTANETEDFWIHFLLDSYDHVDGDTEALKAGLSHEQAKELDERVAQTKASNKLRPLAFAGIQQYLLVPILLVLSIGLSWSYRAGRLYTLVCMLCILVACAAGYLAWTRAYFTSTFA